MNVQFSCNGCGRCCKGHHIPLTLSEANKWALDGGQIIVLLEGFLSDESSLPFIHREHDRQRSAIVKNNTREMHVSITFAAFNSGSCRNLKENNQCGIYETRPLVCRIYPIEINPHIPLKIENKSCDTDTWHGGPVLMVNGEITDQEMLELVEQSRQADRTDIKQKLDICNLLKINVSALKGNGFTAYLPDMENFKAAMEIASDPNESDLLASLGQDWMLHTSDADLFKSIALEGAWAITGSPDNYAFLPIG